MEHKQKTVPRIGLGFRSLHHVGARKWRWGSAESSTVWLFMSRLNSSCDRVGNQYEILGADVRLRFSDARRMVRSSGTEAPGARRCGQADAHDELRARVSSWRPLRLARLRRERESVVVVSPVAPLWLIERRQRNATCNRNRHPAHFWRGVPSRIRRSSARRLESGNSRRPPSPSLPCARWG